jgi:N-acetylglucosaminyldiphosphoundecaprenol N-acetyl-beta-D-mannosaminyltransferase
MATSVKSQLRATPAGSRSVELFGVGLLDVSRADAVSMLSRWIRFPSEPTRTVFIANAHTLNLAWEDSTYRTVLNAADVVFGDGTGVRLAARLKGVRLRDNLVGTDLLPALFAASGTTGLTCFLFGGTADAAARAAGRVERDFPGVRVVGHHHGYVATNSAPVIAGINASGADVLLVAMGNPLQERWILNHARELRVRVAIGVGGLVDHWAGNLHRAPVWVRRWGIEWMQILVQQPHKWRRYLLGNSRFVVRAVRDARDSA